MILLVEDHTELRQAVDEFLTESGHTVHAFGSSRAALAWQQSGGGADLVITDLRMAGMDGGQLLQALWASQPDLPERQDLASPARKAFSPL